MASTERPLLDELRDNAYLVLGFVALIWVVQILDFILPGRFVTWGILPRTIEGLRGIIFAPILHNGLFHVFANTIPFIVLGFLVTMYGQGTYIRVSVFVIVVGGLLTWLLARQAVHVGASGLIMGFLGYLLARGWHDRSFTSVLIAVIAFVFYGGSLWGVTPLVPGFVSWEMHLFGFIAGILAAQLSFVSGPARGN
jgi:membrane associated rhomboid family serine protease